MKDLLVERVDVWAAGIQDAPGSLARLLAGLQDAGADLDFILARRSPEKPGVGVVFVTPLCGDEEIAAAATLGFNVMNSVKSLRVEGDNRPGVASELMEKLGAAGINLRGLSAAVMGCRFIMYLGFDNDQAAAKAADVLQKA